jgi:hypothetical protein
MKADHHPRINIPDNLAARCDGPGQFERFDKLFRAVIAVPKAAINKEEAKEKRRKKRDKKR